MVMLQECLFLKIDNSKVHVKVYTLIKTMLCYVLYFLARYTLN